MPRVVLGGGMAGMIASFFLRCPILEGGKKERGIGINKLGLYYLHTSGGMDSLLNALKFSVGVVEVRGGAIWSTVPVSFKEMSFEQKEEIVEAYCDKTRGTPYDMLSIGDKWTIMDGVLSDKEPWRYQVTFPQLLVALHRVVGDSIIYDIKVKKVDFSNRTIEASCGKIGYGEAFSTLPLKGMFDYAPEIQAINGYCFSFLVHDYGLPEDYDYLYLPGSEYTATRIIFPCGLNKSIDDNIVYLESGNKDIDRAYDDLAKLGCGNVSVVNRVSIKDKRLIGNPTDYIMDIESGQCYLLGRNARWNDNLMINDVADEVMKFEAMFERQLANNLNWIDYDNISDAEREELTKEYVLLAVDELMELLREVNYKHHIMYRKPLVRSNILEEIIDTFKYLLSIALLYGFTPEEFVQAFCDKSDIVDKKWEEEKVEWGSKLLAVDIDGVLANYMASYVGYLYSKGIIDSGDSKYHFSYNIADVYDIPKDIEEKAKRDFQESGGFRALPAYSNASNVLIYAQGLGYKIALISARPYLEIRRIHADTMYWLKEKDIPYDAIFWGKDKADIVFSNLYPIKPTWFIEDRDKHAIELANEGIPVLLMDKPYNQGVEHKNITRVNGWGEIASIIKRK